MLLYSAALIAGLILLVLSSDKFIEHAALVAEKLNVSPIIIGVTLVALGTSAPEMVVSAIAALDNAPGIAIGNVLGSNIANIGLVFGATLVLAAVPISGSLIKREIPLVLGITVLAGVLMADQALSILDGILLIAGFLVVLFVLLRNSKNMASELTEDLPEDDGGSVTRSIIIAVLGLAVLIGSSKLLVWGAVGIASALGVSDLVIGLTIVAIGTSLPELAASITSVRKGHHDIAIGNVLGSNIFNLATVLPLPALLAPSAIEATIMGRDFWWMFGFTALFALAVVGFAKTRKASIPRWFAVPLLGLYTGYLYLLAM
ncbi:calcium/sodium antiporter [Marinomonas ostreistagni]|uniref:calcium/sodium antiporter n=1 Tax=Marinomonas ostreistagni TaxID=359209 RepID=UPI00194FA3F7|nr:calcium/sodium antiporter [Marinomonas ostreistagni]MBM6549856.1 calcium/sodium antiporter [Marinomonas ostreistagni]